MTVTQNGKEAAPEVQAQERQKGGIHTLSIDDRQIMLDGLLLRGVTSYELKKSGFGIPAELILRLCVNVQAQAQPREVRPSTREDQLRKLARCIFEMLADHNLTVREVDIVLGQVTAITGYTPIRWRA